MIHRTVFSQFEEYAASVRDVDVRMSMPALQLPYWAIRHADVGSIHIQRGTEGGGILAEGSTHRDGWGFYNQTAGTWGLANGKRMRPDVTVVIPPGSEFCFACQDAHEWFSVFIPTSLLLPSDEQTLHACAGNTRVVDTSPELSRRLQTLVNRFVSAAEAEPALLTQSMAVDSVRAQFLSVTRSILGIRTSPANRHYMRRRELIKPAIDLIEDSPGAPHTISDLARCAAVPERTLRSAFHGCFDVSPQQYMMARRLHLARSVLLQGDPANVSVRHVATAHGFGDVGRFASRYRKLFGEYPSQTLNQSLFVSRGHAV